MAILELFEILGVEQEKIDYVINRIKAITFKPEVGEVYDVKVIKTLDFGAVVEYVAAPGSDSSSHF